MGPRWGGRAQRPGARPGRRRLQRAGPGAASPELQPAALQRAAAAAGGAGRCPGVRGQEGGCSEGRLWRESSPSEALRERGWGQ